VQLLRRTTREVTLTATAGLAEGMCDVAIIRAGPGDDRLDQHRLDEAIVGLERRYCAMAADDPWVTRRSVRLARPGPPGLVAR